MDLFNVYYIWGVVLIKMWGFLWVKNGVSGPEKFVVLFWGVE
jgi:hypothetical protein